MNTKKEEGNTDISETWTSSRLPVFLTATSYTVGTIAILGGLGYWLDTVLNTKPLIFIIGLVVAFPLSQVMVYRKTKQFANKKTKK
jgi:F0F1-type ATP synthase assembly protein I